MEGYVLVTGGNRGIGRSIVLRFVREGFNVAFTYNMREDEAMETYRLASRFNVKVIYFKMDVSDVESVLRGYELVSREFPYLNVLVNNAGILSITPFEELTLEEWNRVITVNLTGVFIVTKTFLPLLRRAEWASIVNIASIAGQTGHVVASAAYAAAKAGVIALTRKLAVELAPKIRVNAIAPSFVETDMTAELLRDPEARRRIEELHPLRGVATPEDVAEAVFFLATPKSRFITGHTLNVNGGRLTL